MLELSQEQYDAIMKKADTNEIFYHEQLLDDLSDVVSYEDYLNLLENATLPEVEQSWLKYCS